MNKIICCPAAAFAAALGAIVLAVAAASAQQFTMKLSSPTINDVTHEYYKTLKAGVEARAGGRIKVEIYPANQLGQLPAVVEGVATATEVSTIGIAYSLVAGLLIYRGGLHWKAVPQMLIQTASLSGAILFIVGAASAMAWVQR